MPRLACLLILIAVVACAESAAPDDSPAPITTFAITKVSGDHQEADPSSELAQPLIVRVTRQGSADSMPQIVWSADGGGLFRPASVMYPDADGRALVYFTPHTHGARVEVSGTGVAPVEFRVYPRPFVVYADAAQSLRFYADQTFTLRGAGTEAGRFTRQDSVLTLEFGAQGVALANVGAGTMQLRFDPKLLVDFADASLLVDTEQSPLPGWFEMPGPAAPVANYRFTAVRGDGQEGPRGVELPEPLVVTVRSDAGPLAGVRVEWRTMVGTGSFRPGSVTLTDAAGEARVHFTPSTDGARVDASIAGTSHQRSLASFPIPIAVYGDEGHTVSFYPGGTMALRVAGLILGGGYTRTDSLVSLGFGFNLAATGLLRGDSLLVDYDFLTEDWGLADGAFALDPSRSTSDW